MSRGSNGHKSNMAKRNQRTKWNNRHPEGRKAYAKKKKEKRLEKRVKRQRNEP